MKKYSSQNRMRQQFGVTLIELLVSLAIGLAILSAVGVIFVTSSTSNRQQEDQAEINEPARNFISSLRREISLAGYVDVFSNTLNAVAATRDLQGVSVLDNNADIVNIYQRAPKATQLPSPLTTLFAGMFPVLGCDGAMNSSPFAIATAGSLAPGVLCGANNPTQHTLQIAYQGVAAAGITTTLSSVLAANTATGAGLDCLSQTTASASGIIINRYSVAPSAGDGINELVCSGSGNAIAQPIARGVEEFIVRYQVTQPGISTVTTASGGSPGQYLNATAVSADPIGWSAVTGVEVCFVTATAQNRGSAAAGTQVVQTLIPTCRRDAAGQFLADTARLAGDTRLWKRFVSTTAVKNAIYAGVN